MGSWLLLVSWWCLSSYTRNFNGEGDFLNKVATQHYGQVYLNTCNKWQHQEAEMHAFQMEYSLYNVYVFATLVLVAISHKATEYIKTATWK